MNKTDNVRGIIVFFLSAVALSFVCTPAYSQREWGKSRRSQNQLASENESLRRKIDSLETALAKSNATLDSIFSLTPPAADTVTSDIFELSDSLLHSWYYNDSGLRIPYNAAQTETFSSAVPDSVFIARLQAINTPIPLPYNDVVKSYCIKYSEKMPVAMSGILGLCKYYWPIFDEVFSYYGLPLELKALAIVESMLKPNATSRVGAKGFWQFMYGTAKGYGLVVDSWTDERMDPVRSTVAAARFLKYAYKVYGDWSLAIASYNCGGGNISKAIYRSGGKKDYWDIYEFLPKETRGYLPAFVGALYAVTYHREYGIIPAAAPVSVAVDTVVIHKKLHFGQIQDIVGISKDSLKMLNPQYYNSVIPGDSRPCVLRLPVKYLRAFIEASDTVYSHKAGEYLNPVALKKIAESSVYGPPGSKKVTYTVKKGDCLGAVAKRHHVTIAQIKKWNRLKGDNIRIGQKLVIYRKQ